MFPAATAASVAVKPVQPAPPQTAQKTTQPQAPETARTSAGEQAAANVKSETTQAVQAAEQSSVAPRLRDRENAERTERPAPPKDEHAGPPPSFEESPLERQARVAFDPPDLPVASDDQPPVAPVEARESAPETDSRPATGEAPPAFQDPPPTPTERAEVSFAETRTLSEATEGATIDFAR